MLHGRFINDVDNSQQRKVIVLNEDQAKELNEHDPAALVGQYVKMDSLAFRVVGITKSDQTGMNASAYLPFSTLRIIYQMGDKVDTTSTSRFTAYRPKPTTRPLKNAIRPRSTPTTTPHPTTRTLCGYGTASLKPCR